MSVLTGTPYIQNPKSKIQNHQARLPALMEMRDLLDGALPGQIRCCVPPSWKEVGQASRI
jgi:hypothetical protein